MLDAWPVSRRIGSGFLVLTCLIIALSVFSQRAVGNLGSVYLEYRNISKQVVSLNTFFESFSEAQHAAMMYVVTPRENLKAAVVEKMAEISDRPEIIEPFETSADRLSEVRQIIANAVGYKDSFLMLSDHLQTAADLEQTIDADLTAFETDMNAIFSVTVQTGTAAIISAAGLTLQSAMAAIAQARQFKLTGDPDDLSQFETRYGDFERNFRRLSARNGQDTTARQISQLEQRLQGFPDAFVAFSQSQQTTRALKTRVLNQDGPSILAGIHQIADDISNRQEEIGPNGEAILGKLQKVIPAAGVTATLIALLLTFGIGRWVTRAISRLADTTDALAGGNNNVEILGTQHSHELGRVARALNVFRQAQIDRGEVMAEHAQLQEQQNKVVETMKTELAKVADGDLTRKIDISFAAEYDALRENFNDAIEALHAAISRVNDTTALISQTTSQTASATNELSQRTENQAATLEQTAAALDELTASVKSAAEHAKSVDSSVIRARTEATKNGEIVAQAVAAMSAIEQSSKQISQVIGVIDDIAFQTNLLALNAGVEAARAGESGRGFAVVASEVRALAQRSAEAAKEISGLIANSSRHVEQGTELVGNAGEALGEIITQVNDISSMTSQIATSAEEQAIGLSEINIGVNQLDQVTQQNAAMVQDQIMRGDMLSAETQKLSNLIKQFRIRAGQGNDRTQEDGVHELESAIAGTDRDNRSPSVGSDARDASGHSTWQSA